MANGVRLDKKGIGEFLKNDCRALVNEAVNQLAASIEGETVKSYQTDRAAGSVAVPAEDQAIDGVLTRAASAAGLRIYSR